MEELISGTVVWFVTGGPKMIVFMKDFRPSPTNQDKYICRWFDGNDLKEGIFSRTELTTENPSLNS